VDRDGWTLHDVVNRRPDLGNVHLQEIVDGGFLCVRRSLDGNEILLRRVTGRKLV
jgi:hypothetical protein